MLLQWLDQTKRILLQEHGHLHIPMIYPSNSPVVDLPLSFFSSTLVALVLNSSEFRRHPEAGK